MCAAGPAGHILSMADRVDISERSGVGVRLLTPDDTDRLARMLTRMSPEARYRRFFTPLPRIPRRLPSPAQTRWPSRRLLPPHAG
jgi:hypothetical protein